LQWVNSILRVVFNNALTALSNPKFQPKQMGISTEIAAGLTKRQAGFSTTFMYKKAYASS